MDDGWAGGESFVAGASSAGRAATALATEACPSVLILPAPPTSVEVASQEEEGANSAERIVSCKDKA